MYQPKKKTSSDDNKFTINLEGKPYLSKAFNEDKETFKEVVSTFVAMMEESLDDSKGIRWADLAEEIHADLSFKELITGILRGTLDVKEMNPALFSALKVEAHPLAMLSPRRDAISGDMRLRNWRQHFRQPQDSVINEQTIANILKTILRYTRYVSITKLAEAMDTNQEMTFRGLGSRVMELLPMRPAIEYQRKQKGDLFVGTFDLDTGGLDCGELDDHICPACKRDDFLKVSDKTLCLTCNASYTTKENE